MSRTLRTALEALEKVGEAEEQGLVGVFHRTHAQAAAQVALAEAAFERRPVGVTTDADGLIVVCNDGSVWHAVGRKWVEWVPLPGTPAARRQP